MANFALPIRDSTIHRLANAAPGLPRRSCIGPTSSHLNLEASFTKSIRLHSVDFVKDHRSVAKSSGNDSQNGDGRKGQNRGKIAGFTWGLFLSVPVTSNFGHSGDLLDDLDNPRLAQTSLRRTKTDLGVLTLPQQRYTEVRCLVKEKESQGIEDEQMVSERPASLLREGEDVQWDNPSTSSMRAKYETVIRKAQDDICAAVEAVDGTKFREDSWIRPGGGGGISRVLQDGNVFEKAGVNVSVVYGTMPPEAYRAATGGSSVNGSVTNKAGRIPFFAAGVSSVMHPKNPMAPTVHFNYRYFETDAPQGVEGAPRAWWFGGGTDLTPSYIFDEDVTHFHQVQKQACDNHDPTFYPKFKKWCDDYFMIKHRGERRGLGGIFFDDLNDRDAEKILAFSADCANSVIPAYIPLIEKRKDMPFTTEHKAWQQLRRGRYVEFNLVYDRGTTFGLKTGGRIESILMSLPLTARWEYDHQPEEGSEEWKLLDACRNPKEWVPVA